MYERTRLYVLYMIVSSRKIFGVRWKKKKNDNIKKSSSTILRLVSAILKNTSNVSLRQIFHIFQNCAHYSGMFNKFRGSYLQSCQSLRKLLNAEVIIMRKLLAVSPNFAEVISLQRKFFTFKRKNCGTY